VVLMGCAVESPACYPSPWCWWAGRPDAIRLSYRGCGGTVIVVPIGNPDGSPTRRRCNGKEVKAAICPEMKVQCCTCLLPVVRDGLLARFLL
jgi:hypothetical protein